RVARELFAQLVLAEVELDASAGVEQMREAVLAVPAQRHDPPGQAHALAGLGLDSIPPRQDLRGVVRRIETVGVRLHPQGAPLGELRLALPEDLGEGHGRSYGLRRARPGRCPGEPRTLGTRARECQAAQAAPRVTPADRAGVRARASRRAGRAR